MGVTATHSNRKLRQEGRNLSRSVHSQASPHPNGYQSCLTNHPDGQRGDFTGHLTLMFLLTLKNTSLSDNSELSTRSEKVLLQDFYQGFIGFPPIPLFLNTTLWLLPAQIFNHQSFIWTRVCYMSQNLPQDTPNLCDLQCRPTVGPRKTFRSGDINLPLADYISEGKKKHTLQLSACSSTADIAPAAPSCDGVQPCRYLLSRLWNNTWHRSRACWAECCTDPEAKDHPVPTNLIIQVQNKKWQLDTNKQTRKQYLRI